MPVAQQQVILVSEDDICNAVPGDPGHCAIAKAVKRAVPEATHINVGRGTISYTIERKRYTHRTSLVAAKAQEKLDKGKAVTAEDFPPIRLHMDEALVKDSRFTVKVSEQQNKRRAEIREGVRKVKKMSKAEREKRRRGRRHA